MLLRQTCVIERADRSTDAEGGWVAEFATIATGVACKYDPRSAAEQARWLAAPTSGSCPSDA